MTEETRLLQSSKTGDTAAFEKIVNRYQSMVCAITFSGTGRVDTSEDLAQETFLRAWKNLGQLKDLAGFRAWLCTIARNVLHNHYRQKKTVSLDQSDPDSFSSGSENPSETLIRQEELVMLEQAIMQIPAEYREPLVMFYRQHQSTRDVAESLGLNESTVRTRLHRARQMLREEIAARLERTLTQTAPGKTFTKAVMAAVGAGLAASAAGTASAAVSVTGAAGTGASAVNGLAAVMSTVTAKIFTTAAIAALAIGGVFAYKHLSHPDQPPIQSGDTAVVEIKQEPVATVNSTETKLSDVQEVAVKRIQTREIQTIEEPQDTVVSLEQETKDDKTNKEIKKDTAPVETLRLINYSGIVIDETGVPIEGVLVSREWITSELELYKDTFKATTNENGVFQFGPVRAIDATLRISGKYLVFDHPNYGKGWWYINHEEPNNLEIPLFKSAVVSGTVSDNLGNPVEGALVQADIRINHESLSQTYYNYFTFSEVNQRSVLSDPNGRFVFEQIPYVSGLHLYAAHQNYGQYSTKAESADSDSYPIKAGDEDIQLTLTGGGYIKGRLVKDGQAYEKAGVRIVAQELSNRNIYDITKTSASGEFETNGLYAGTYSVAATSEDFAEHSLVCDTISNVSVKDTGIPTEIELTVRSGIPVNVYVFDEVTGGAVSDTNVSVKLTDGTRIPFTYGRTDAKGKTVLLLKEGQYNVSAQGWQNGRIKEFPKRVVVGSSAKEVTVEIGIQSKGVISGWLMDTAGNPMLGDVMLGFDNSVETNNEGFFALPEPWYSPGDVHIGYAFDKSRTMGRVFFWKPTDSPNALEIVLEPLTTITGIIVNEDGLGLADVVPSISIRKSSSSSTGANNALWDISIRPDGCFQFDGVPVGVPMYVFAEKPGFQGRADLGELQAGEVREVGNLVVKRLSGFGNDEIDWTGTLSGRVTDEQGNPVMGFRIGTSVGLDRFEDVTDKTGKYKLKKLPKDKKLYVGGYRKGYGHCYSNVVVDDNDFDLQIFPQGWDLLQQPAPGLFVEKWLNSAPKSMEQLRGKVILLQIGVLLPNYLDQFKGIEKVFKKYAEQGLEVIAIHQRLSVTWAGEVTEKALYDFIEKYNVNFPFGIDDQSEKVRDIAAKTSGNGAMYSLYDVKATPALYLIDRQGILRISPTDEVLEDWIELLLAE